MKYALYSLKRAVPRIAITLDTPDERAAAELVLPFRPCLEVSTQGVFLRLVKASVHVRTQTYRSIGERKRESQAILQISTKAVIGTRVSYLKPCTATPVEWRCEEAFLSIALPEGSLYTRLSKPHSDVSRDVSRILELAKELNELLPQSDLTPVIEEGKLQLTVLRPTKLL